MEIGHSCLHISSPPASSLSPSHPPFNFFVLRKGIESSVMRLAANLNKAEEDVILSKIKNVVNSAVLPLFGRVDYYYVPV
jgi:DNA-binding FadR family transcriptional regulator